MRILLEWLRPGVKIKRYIFLQLVSISSLIYAIPIIIISMLINIFQNYLYFIIDLRKPKLHWNTEYAVVKQNMNMLYEFVISVAIMGLLVIGGFLISDINVWIAIFIAVAIFGLGTFIVDRFVFKNQEKLFEKIN